MDGGEHHPVAALVNTRPVLLHDLGRIEGRIGNKGGKVLVAGKQGPQLFEILAATGIIVVVETLENLLVIAHDDVEEPGGLPVLPGLVEHFGEPQKSFAPRFGVGIGGKHADRVIGGLQPVENLLNALRTDLLQKKQDTVPGEAVGRIVDDPHEGQHVLDMGGFGEFHAAPLFKGDLPAGKLHLQFVGMETGTEKNGDLVAGFAFPDGLLDPVGNEPGLFRLVFGGKQDRFLPPFDFCEEGLGVLFRGIFDDRVGKGQNRLATSIIALEADDFGTRRIGWETA